VDTDGITEAVYTAVPDMFNQFFRADDTILVEHKILQQSTFLSAALGNDPIQNKVGQGYILMEDLK